MWQRASRCAQLLFFSFNDTATTEIYTLSLHDALPITFGLAVNRRWQNRQTQAWEEATSFLDVVVWRELAENVSASLTKGSRVIVIGRMEQRSWETQEGDKRSKVEVLADEVGPSLRWATVQIERVQR